MLKRLGLPLGNLQEGEFAPDKPVTFANLINQGGGERPAGKNIFKERPYIVVSSFKFQARPGAVWARVSNFLR